MLNSPAEQANFFKDILLNISDPVFVLEQDHDNSFKLIFANRSLNELVDFNGTENGDISELLARMNVNILDSQNLQQLFSKGDSAATEFRMTKADLLFELKIVPLNQGSKENTQLICVLKDITDSRKEEITLRESEKFNRTVLESSPDCLKIIDVGGRLQFMNFNGLCQMEIDDFGKVKGNVWWELWGEENSSLVKSAVDKALTGEISQFVAQCLTAKGNMRWWDVTVSPVSNSAGEVYQILSVSRDITEQKEAEERIRLLNTSLEEKVAERTNELLAKNIDLEISNQELATFNYIASHDLQEPLRKIQFFTNLILSRDEKLKEEHEHFGKILSASERMRSLIDAINKLTQTKHAEMKLSKCDLNIILADVREFLKESIDERAAIVEFDELPVVEGVDVLLSQLFLNLIENSLKYSKDNSTSKVHISASLLEEGKFDHPVLKKDKSYHKICISDNGIGFDNEFRDQIFGLFQRLHPKENYSGTGVGLTICKKIVEKHGGWIEAEGVVDEGCTFMIYLPKI